MNYGDNYNYSQNSKIPYDDTPISRTERSQKKVRNSSNVSASTQKILACLVAVLVVVNIVLCSVSVYFLRHSKTKEVNVFYNDIVADTESLEIASTTAKWSTVCVGAGGSVGENYDSFFNSTRSRGAGVIYRKSDDDKTIYFITCYHVVKGYTDRVWVMLPSRLKALKVEVVASSPHYDISVLKYTASSNVDNILDGCVPISIYDSGFLSEGESVFAVGNPLSSGFSITRGVVSRLNTMITVDENNYSSREIQTDASINPGNSGGGLFNAEGKFVGLVNAKLNSSKTGTTTITVAGTAYAIPSNLVCSIAESIIKNNGKPTYVNLGCVFTNNSDLGITKKEVTDSSGKLKELERYYVEVSSVAGGSLASGKLHAYDIVDKVELTVIECGKVTQKTIEMRNIYSFEDYSFSIVSGSTMVFYVRSRGIGESKPVEIVASSFVNVTGEN